MTIAEFIRARLDEDEADFAGVHLLSCGEVPVEGDPIGPTPCDCGYPARVGADVRAKRTILADYENAEALYDRDREAPDAVAALRAVIHHMAAPYATHPDYDPSWSPA